MSNHFLSLTLVPVQAGGRPAAGQRPARQSLRAAGRGGARAGAEQPQTGSGQEGGAAEDPGVRRWGYVDPAAPGCGADASLLSPA